MELMAAESLCLSLVSPLHPCLGSRPSYWVILHQQSALLYAGGASTGAKQVTAGWLSTKRVLAVLFLLGPWLVQLADQAGLLHHPQSHLVHALINVFSALWAVAVVGIALNGGLADLHARTSAGQISLSAHCLSLASRRGCCDWRQPQDLHTLCAAELAQGQTEIGCAWHALSWTQMLAAQVSNA